MAQCTVFRGTLAAAFGSPTESYQPDHFLAYPFYHKKVNNEILKTSNQRKKNELMSVLLVCIVEEYQEHISSKFSECKNQGTIDIDDFRT